MRIIKLLLILMILTVLVTGCGKRVQPDTQVKVHDEMTQMEEPIDEEIPEEEADLDLEVEIDDTNTVDDETTMVDEPAVPKPTIDFDGLDLGLEESTDEELPDNDIEEIK